MLSFKDLISDLEKNCISLHEDDENITCMVESEENYEEFTRRLKIAGISFSVQTSNTKRDGKLVYSNQNLGIDFFGFPFTVTNHQRLECVNGPGKARKVKQTQQQSDVIDGYPKTNEENTRTRRRKDSRKTGCTAAMKISTIKYFPDYGISLNGPNIHDRKAECMRRLKADLQKTEADVVYKTRFYISMSHPTTHSHSLWSSSTSQQLDERLKAEIKRLVYDGTTDVILIKTALKNYVTRHFSESIPQQNRAFFPSNRTVYNFILKFVNELKSQSGQINSSVFRSRDIQEPEPYHYEREPDHYELKPIQVRDVSLPYISIDNLRESAQALMNVLYLIPENANLNELRILNDLIVNCKNLAQRVVVNSEENLAIVPDDTDFNKLPKRKKIEIIKNCD